MFAHKRSQRQKEGKDKIEFDFATEKKGLKHKEISLDAKELRKIYDKEGRIEIFLAKSGTKVHFVRECPGLNAADFTRIQTRTLCGHCLKSQRLFTEDPEEAFSL